MPQNERRYDSEYMMCPSKTSTDEARAEVRRHQVLEAAAQCFKEKGFHNASMQLIARTAGMSVGHIYHYFANKEAIIEAIVAADEALTQQQFSRFLQEALVAEAMVQHADEGFDRCVDQDKSALLMEILSESVRNPVVRQIVQQSDDGLRQQMQGLLDRVHEELRPGQAINPVQRSVQITLLCSLFDGLRVRSIRCAQLAEEREAIVAMLRPIIRHILAG